MTNWFSMMLCARAGTRRNGVKVAIVAEVKGRNEQDPHAFCHFSWFSLVLCEHAHFMDWWLLWNEDQFSETVRRMGGDSRHRIPFGKTGKMEKKSN
jgi:hypothetical protein